MAHSETDHGRAEVIVPQSEYDRLRAIEDAARWHLNNSACRGWEQGEVLAIALGLDPDAPQRSFERLLDALGVDMDDEDRIPDWWRWK